MTDNDVILCDFLGPDPDGWGDFPDAAPLSGDLAALDDVEVARRLMVLLSQVSETCYCAGWLIGIGSTSRTWTEPGAPDARRWGMDDVDAATIAALRAARARLGDRWVCGTERGVVLTTVGSAAWGGE